MILDDLDQDRGGISGHDRNLGNSWDVFTPFLGLPIPIRKLIYTSNMVESLNARFRSAVQKRKDPSN